mmetsp:Transcript_42038/g.121453  ORF Transcript_42038/g.121453 Transcript_42038/m.121453 type:complete len:515 (+) Transcript_42038:184-1728(+)
MPRSRLATPVAVAFASAIAAEAAPVLGPFPGIRGSGAPERRGPKSREALPPLGLLALGVETHEVAAASISEPLALRHAAPAVAAASASTGAAPPAIAGANATLATAIGDHKPIPSRSWFALTFSFAFMIKALCMASNVIFQVSPFPQVMQFNKLGDTGEVDAAPLVSILYGGCQWCFYGTFAYVVTQKSGFLVLVYSNMLGAFLGFYYLWGFQRNCRNKQSLRNLEAYLRAASSVALMQLAAMMVLPRHKALFLCGLASCVCSVVGACSLLATMPKVIETKCSATINLPLVCVGLVSGMLWLTCGLLLMDAWIIVPNCACIVVNCATLSMTVYFPRDTEKAAALVAAEAAAARERMPDAVAADVDAPSTGATRSARRLPLDVAVNSSLPIRSPLLSTKSAPQWQSASDTEAVRSTRSEGHQDHTPLLPRSSSASATSACGQTTAGLSLTWRPAYGSAAPPGTERAAGALLAPAIAWPPRSPEPLRTAPREHAPEEASEESSPIVDEFGETGGTW